MDPIQDLVYKTITRLIMNNGNDRKLIIFLALLLNSARSQNKLWAFDKALDEVFLLAFSFSRL